MSFYHMGLTFSVRNFVDSLGTCRHLSLDFLVSSLATLRLSTLQTQPQSFVTQGPPLFTKTTKFNDLSEDVRKVFEAIE
jgi:hypothetical protein